MTKNQILTSSDHHANWDALEKLFQVAMDKKIPFIINGDIIGDYNFEEIKDELNLRYPYEIHKNQKIDLATELNISLNLVKLKSLYQIIIKLHAKKLAKLIDKYHVQTYFLLGNHEPINFIDITKSYLENKNLLKDLGKIKKIEEINGIRIAGISNVCAIMPFIYDIYEDKEINKMFSHQVGQERPMLHGNVTKKYMENSLAHIMDPDWIRIMTHENGANPNLDIFFTHGQIGIGAWRESKICDEVPTLHSAAAMSSLAKITIDGHLHTTHEMTNSLNKKTLRAVGNNGFLLTRNSNDAIEKELVTVNADYDSRGKINLNEIDLEKEILSEMSLE